MGLGAVPAASMTAKALSSSRTLEKYSPSGFLPISAGNVRKQSLAELYRYSPLFVALRDSSNLKGKCGICEFREVCGGSRARAYALTGDPFAEEPCCIWQPKIRVTASKGGEFEKTHT
jgi:radical SAM protein with 4Fe4S-binding SPASM domain